MRAKWPIRPELMLVYFALSDKEFIYSALREDRHYEITVCFPRTQPNTPSRVQTWVARCGFQGTNLPTNSYERKNNY